MITTTYTYVTFWSSDKSKKAVIDGLEKQLSDFTATQTDVDLEAFLMRFLAKKPLIDAHGIDKIAIYHTLLYENQCNTEFSPKVIDLVQKIGATLCISTDCVRRNKLVCSVPSGGDGIIEATVEQYSQEIKTEIPMTFDDSAEVLFADIDVTDLDDRQIFELGFRYGQRCENDKHNNK